MRAMRNLVRKFRKSVQVRGAAGTILYSIAAILSVLSISHRRVLARKKAADMDFDRKYSVDTGGLIPLSNLDVEGENWKYGAGYEAIFNVDFGEILKSLALPYDKTVFIDMGSGKGRAVLLASMLPFKKVIGVEFSRQLHQTAEKNARNFQGQKCGEIELICIDAVEYKIPENPLVIYLYNPFERPIMEKVVENVVASFRSRPRRLVVLYFSLDFPGLDMWDGTGFLERVVSKRNYILYDTNKYYIVS